LNIKLKKMQSFRYQLHWGSFVGHCFKCGELGNFMVECQRTLVSEVLNTPCSVMVMPNQGDIIVLSEESKTKERPWIEVDANGKFSKYHTTRYWDVCRDSLP
jgi:hypothetical protein